MATKKPQIPTPEQVRVLQTEIEGRTTHLPDGKPMQENELLREVTAAYPAFDAARLRYLRSVQVIQPPKGNNNYHVYTTQDLRQILLVLALKDKNGDWRLSYSQIFSILLWSLRQQLLDVQDAVKSIEVPVGQTQRERGLYFWRSSLIRYLLLYLFEGKLPPGTYVFLYKPRHSILERDNGRVPWLKVERCEFERIEYRLKDSSLTLVTSDNGDVFHPSASNTVPQPYQRSATWYQIEGGGRDDPSDYDVILAVPDGRRQCRQPEQASVICLLLRLIDGCFLDAGDITPNNHQVLTALDLVTGLIPKMSPAWQYCACFAPATRAPDRLIIRSASKWFPADSRQPAQIGVGQLLSGRAYQEKYPVVVQRALDDNDPRIAEDHPAGAAAVPTLYNSDVNGVLYVASRNHLPAEPLFSEANADVALLRILGLIAGQLLGQDEALTQSGRMSLTIVDDPISTVHPWDSLRARLTKAIADVKESSAVALSKDSIHLVAIQLKRKTYEHLETIDPGVAKWAVEQLQTSAVRYFTAQDNPPPKPPEIYTRSLHEFLLLLPQIPSSDEADHRMREDLRKRLNSLSLALPGKGQPVEVECDLWSLPFRYSELLRFKGDVPEQVNRMIASAEEAFVFLPFVYQAHQHERAGAWVTALEQYRLAWRLAPRNPYLLRHIAKAQTQLGRYEEAINRWLEMLAQQKHPSHYRRLAHNLAALGTEEALLKAIDAIDEAIKMDPRDAKNHATAASIYAIANQPDKAIAELELAAAYDSDNAARYLLQVAGLYCDQGRYDEALDTCIMAQTHDPDDRDILAMMMKAAWAMNRPQQPPSQ